MLLVVIDSFLYTGIHLSERVLGTQTIGILSKKTMSMWLDFTNILYVIISFYLLFVKHVKSPIYLFVCILLLFKAFVHIAANHKILNISPQVQQKIKTFYSYEALITNLILFVLSYKILNTVF
jgi:hypothetical protein